MSIMLGFRGSSSGISMSGSSSASSVLSLTVCLSISSFVHGCAGEKVGCLDWTGVGVSSLSKNLPVVSLLVLSVVESDGGQRVWWGAEMQKQLKNDMVGNSLLLDSRR